MNLSFYLFGKHLQYQAEAGWTGGDSEKQTSGIQRLWKCCFFQVGEHGFECNFKPTLYRIVEKDEACTPSEWQSMVVSQSIPTLSGWAFGLQGSWKCRLTIQIICRSKLKYLTFCHFWGREWRGAWYCYFLPCMCCWDNTSCFIKINFSVWVWLFLTVISDPQFPHLPNGTHTLLSGISLVWFL